MSVPTYDPGEFYDEMFDASGQVRPEARLLLDTLGALGDGQLQRCQQAADRVSQYLQRSMAQDLLSIFSGGGGNSGGSSGGGRAPDPVYGDEEPF
mgnify:CR=1 FL=1